MGADRPEDRVADRQLMSACEVFVEANMTFRLDDMGQIKEKSYPNQINHGFPVGLI